MLLVATGQRGGRQRQLWRGEGGSSHCCRQVGFVAPGLCFQLCISAVYLGLLMEQHNSLQVMCIVQRANSPPVLQLLIRAP